VRSLRYGRKALGMADLGTDVGAEVEDRVMLLPMSPRIISESGWVGRILMLE
jgi:hypothetical protein